MTPEEIRQFRDDNRCAVCGWPLDPDGKMCVRGNCSQRPSPSRFYDPERVKAEYGQWAPVEKEPPVSTPCVLCAPTRDALEHAQSENLDLHLVAQGVKHYWRCRHDARGSAGEIECPRCRAEAAERELADVAKALNERDEWKGIADATGVYGTSSARELLEASLTRAEQAEAALAALRGQVEACAPYLKDGETPAECIDRNRRDIDALMTLFGREKLRTETLTRALVEAAVPLEAIYAATVWELAPEVKNSVGLALATIRATLAERPSETPEA